MLLDRVALQSVQGSLDSVGSHRYVRCILQWPCPVVLLTVALHFKGHGTQPQSSDHGTNWTMLQSGKGALRGIRAFHERQHVQLKLSLLCNFGR